MRTHFASSISEKTNPIVTSLCSPSSPPPVFLVFSLDAGAKSSSTHGGRVSGGAVKEPLGASWGVSSPSSGAGPSKGEDRGEPEVERKRDRPEEERRG
jgi:hypothetical protein